MLKGIGLRLSKQFGGGQNSFQTTSDGTSNRIGNQSETSENCSGHRRLDCPPRPQTLARQQFYGGGQQQPNSYQKDIWTADGTGWTPFSKHKYINKNQLRSVERGGFSQSSSSDRLTDEQMEDLIAENIYDWWISGKSYKKWYADKFLQLKLEFE